MLLKKKSLNCTVLRFNPEGNNCSIEGHIKMEVNCSFNFALNLDEKMSCITYYGYPYIHSDGMRGMVVRDKS